LQKETSLKIILTKRSEDIHACLESDHRIWGCGKSQYEAIGNLINAHQSTFGVTVEYEGIEMASPFNPSPNWTRYERQELINVLQRKARMLKFVELPEANNADARNKLLYQAVDCEERIEFLKSRPVSFLEANRSAILNGQLTS
jgi:hypothetical protein